MVKAAYEHEGPVYLRFSRAASPIIHEEPCDFVIGKGEVLKDGEDGCIIAVGITVGEALKAANSLEAEGIHLRVVNMGSIKPLDEELILQCAKECEWIITVEEHNVIGGLGEAVAALCSEHHPVHIRKLGVQDRFGPSGSAAELLKEYGLTSETIIQTVKEMGEIHSTE
jgi:transketolase